MKKYIQIILTTMLLISSALDAGVKSKAAKEIVKIFGKYGLNISKKVPKGKMDDFLSAARKLPKTSKTGINRISAGKLIVKYGDDAVKILIKHPDDGLWALKNGGEFVAKNYSKMGKPLLKFLGRNGKRGPKIAKHLGIDLSNNILKLSPKSGLMGLQKITNPKLLKEALANAPDKILKSNIIKNAAIYGDEFLQFTLKHKKPIIVASVFTSGLIAGVNKYPSPPDTLMFNDPEFLFDSDGLHVSQNNHVKYYLKLFSDRNKDSYNNIRMGLDNYSKYKHIIEPIIQEFGLPKSLVALAILESSLNPMAGSSKGAVGPWQFLESTAEEKRLRSYKLKVNRYIDERRDIIKSTHAACKYLKYHYNKYDDWYLAMAAYNYGQKKTDDWIKIFGTNDFWELAKKSKENGKYGFPPETRNYIPKILAIMIIMDDPDKYNHTIQDFRTVAFYQVQKGDSLSLIAQKYNINVNELKKANSKIKNINKIYPNQIVEIPNQS